MIETLLLKQSKSSDIFLGEIPSSELINGLDLAAAVGLVKGTAQHSDAGWLKFNDDGVIKYVAKKTLRYKLSWAQLNTLGIVTGSKRITINDLTYKVRLLQGRNNTLSHTYGFDTPATHGSEWNRLMYHISGGPFLHAENSLASEGITEGDWAQYSEQDLLMHSAYGYGSESWCQEISDKLYWGGTKGYYQAYVTRGRNGVSYQNRGAESVCSGSACAFGPTNNHGWRPCLELVP